MNLGPSEIFLVLLAALLLFGGKRLPEVARNIGRGLSEVRRMTFDVKRDLTADLSDPPPRRPTASTEINSTDKPADTSQPTENAISPNLAAQPRSSEKKSGSDS